MHMAHVELVLHESSRCEIKGFRVISFYERKVQRNTCKGCNVLSTNNIPMFIIKRSINTRN